MFQEFAVVVTVAIAVSALVSLTLTPMMGGRLLRQEHAERQGRWSRGLERAFEGMVTRYDKLLGVVLRHRFITLMAAVQTQVIKRSCTTRLSPLLVDISARGAPPRLKIRDGRLSR